MGLGDALRDLAGHRRQLSSFGGGTYAVSAHLGSWMAGLDSPPAHPIDLIAGLVKGRVPWPVQSTVAAAPHGRRGPGPGHRRARGLVEGCVQAYPGRQGRPVPGPREVLGRVLREGREGHGRAARRDRTRRASWWARLSPPARRSSSWEDISLDIWGPRTGKTTSRAIPAILDAPGAVVATSNKRDVVDVTRDVRERRPRCGCSIRRPSPRRNRTGGGTRCPT